MLTHLAIRNLAVVRDLAMDLADGFTVLTGETGAGKSVLVGALGLVLGGRADPEAVRAGETEAVVEACFDLVAAGGDAVRRLEAVGLEPADELVVRRVVAAGGRSRVFLNGSTASVAMLRAVTDGLVEISGQHEYHGLLREGAGLSLLDAFAGLSDEVARYREEYDRLAAGRARLSELLAAAREAGARAEFLRFQVAEIDQAAPVPGEEEELRVRRDRLRNRERLLAALSRAEDLLSGGAGSVLSALGQVEGDLRRVAALDPALDRAAADLASARVLVEDVLFSLRRVGGTLEGDGDRLDAIEERLEVLRRIFRKHGPSVPEVLARREAMAEELAALSRIEDSIGAARAEVERLARSVRSLGQTLSERRREAAERMSREVARELAALDMPAAVLRVRVEPRAVRGGEGQGPEGEGDVTQGGAFGPDGMDRVVLLFGPNPGEEPAPLSRIASGGELSRVMLAVKGVLSERDPCRTCVFDEVDAGIGGATADAVGDRLEAVAAARQVLCVTHLPQIAARADRHFLVEKREEGGRTVSLVRALDGEERVRELARMLAGRDLTPIALAHAAEMLRSHARHPR